jgi:hypothetical protein
MPPAIALIKRSEKKKKKKKKKKNFLQQSKNLENKSLERSSYDLCLTVLVDGYT